MTANEKVLDLFIRHQTYLLRYAGGLRNELASILEGTEGDLSLVLQKFLELLEGHTLATPQDRKLLTKMQAEIEDARAQAWAKIATEFSSQMTAFATAEAASTVAIISGAVPVALGLALPPADKLKQIAVSQPFEGATLKQWVKQSQFADTERITKAVKRGIVVGQTPTQISREILGTQRSKNNSVSRKAFRDLESLTLTASASVQNQVREELYDRNSDVFQEELFVATLDGRTTFQCARNDGKLYKVGEGPQPPLHFRCRSLRVPYLGAAMLASRPFNASTEKLLVAEYAKERGLGNILSRNQLPRGTKGGYDAFARAKKRELIGTVPAETTFDAWFKKQTKAFQEEYLGPTRAKMYREDKLSIGSFVTPTGRTLTLPELKAKGLEVPQ